jgi:hypothetical protein
VIERVFILGVLDFLELILKFLQFNVIQYHKQNLEEYESQYSEEEEDSYEDYGYGPGRKEKLGTTATPLNWTRWRISHVYWE